MIAEAGRRFLRVSVSVTRPMASIPRLDRIKAWLNENCGANGWAMKKAALEQSASDAARQLFHPRAWVWETHNQAHLDNRDRASTNRPFARERRAGVANDSWTLRARCAKASFLANKMGPQPMAASSGFSSRLDRIKGRARRELWRKRVAMTPSGTRDVLNDALSIYFGNPTLASALVARWCARSRIETGSGVFQVRENEPTPR